MTLSCVMRFGGRRYRKCVVNAAAISEPCDAAANPSPLIIDYVSDGVEEIADYDGSGDLLRRYIHGPGIDEPLAMISYNADTGAETGRQYYHADHLGSIIAMSDASGAVAEVYTYSAYGEVNNATGNPFRYTGRRLDAETGLYYYRARYYSSALGRFLQTDPIGYGDGLNWYAYVGNDPVNGKDPSGEFINFLVGALIGAVVDTAIQLASSCGSSGGCSVNLQQVGVAAVFGAVSSGTSALAASVTRSAVQRIAVESAIEAGVGVVNAEVTRAVTGETEVSAGEQIKEDGITLSAAGAASAGINAAEGNQGVLNSTVTKNFKKEFTGAKRPTLTSILKSVASGVITGLIADQAQEASDVCGEIGANNEC